MRSYAKPGVNPEQKGAKHSKQRGRQRLYDKQCVLALSMSLQCKKKSIASRLALEPVRELVQRDGAAAVHVQLFEQLLKAGVLERQGC